MPIPYTKVSDILQKGGGSTYWRYQIPFPAFQINKQIRSDPSIPLIYKDYIVANQCPVTDILKDFGQVFHSYR